MQNVFEGDGAAPVCTSEIRLCSWIFLNMFCSNLQKDTGSALAQSGAHLDLSGFSSAEVNKGGGMNLVFG